jgi:RNA polymerase sigma factor (sigma-70 family)
MASQRASTVIQFLRRIAGPPPDRDLADRRLLERFVTAQDQAAFAALVQRHGPMVLGVCRRLLHDAHEAEDAFQATFLVLVHKARSIGRPEFLGPWLHGVAYRVAARARQAARRRGREREAAAMPDGDPAVEVVWRELRQVLDEELGRLAQKYRAPLVLFYLEGKTTAEVARQLGCPKGTVLSRLARGRDRLRIRLVRRGVALSVGVMVGVLAEQAAPAAVPPALALGTVNAAVLTAAGQAAAGAIPATVAALTQGVLRAMVLIQLKIVVALVLAVTVAVVGTVVGARRVPADKPAAAGKEQTPKDKEKADKPAAAGKEQAPKDKEKIEKVEEILDRMSKVYATCKSYHDSGVVKTVFVEAGGNRTVEKPFTTAFVRPDRLRFEYKEKGGDGQEQRHIVWRKGKEVQTWWDVRPGIEKPGSVGLALGGAAGVSGGSATAIPALLLPDEVGGRLTAMTAAKRVQDAKLGKAECFRIEGTFGVSPTTLWIEKATFLVRRIDMQMKFDNSRTETTTTYDPAIDGEVNEKNLEFDPPMQK